MPEIFCNRCGARNAELANFCGACGAPLASAVQPALATEPILESAAATQVPPPAVQFPAAPAVRYGGFWIRFVAVIIDAIIVEAVVVPVSFVLGAMIALAGVAVAMPGEGVRLVEIIVGGVFGILANWIYEATLESSSRQATVGKMAMGLKVTDLEGFRISFARATGRHFAKFLSGMILAIGYIMAGFTERHQTLHDMVAGTLVQRT